jgi:hypothetical protein
MTNRCEKAALLLSSQKQGELLPSAVMDHSFFGPPASVIGASQDSPILVFLPVSERHPTFSLLLLPVAGWAPHPFFQASLVVFQVAAMASHWAYYNLLWFSRNKLCTAKPSDVGGLGGSAF